MSRVTTTTRVSLQHTATHYNTLHNTATHCTTLHHTAPHCIMHHAHMNESRHYDYMRRHSYHTREVVTSQVLDYFIVYQKEAGCVYIESIYIYIYRVSLYIYSHVSFTHRCVLQHTATHHTHCIHRVMSVSHTDAYCNTPHTLYI